MKKLFTLLSLTVGVSLFSIGIMSSASAGTSNANDPNYWSQIYGAQCIKYDPQDSSPYGHLSGDANGVILDQTVQVLIVKGGSVNGGNAVYESLGIGVVYLAPLNAGGQQAGVSHWIVCLNSPTTTTSTTSTTTTAPTTSSTTTTSVVTTTTVPTTSTTSTIPSTTTIPTTTTSTTSTTTIPSTTTTNSTTTTLPTTTSVPTTSTTTSITPSTTAPQPVIGEAVVQSRELAETGSSSWLLLVIGIFLILCGLILWKN